MSCCNHSGTNSAIDQAVNDALADRIVELEGYKDSAATSATSAANSSAAAQQASIETKEYRDQTQEIANQAAGLVPDILEASNNLKDVADTLEAISQTASSYTVVNYYYTVVGGETGFTFPDEVNVASVQAIYIEGVRQDNGHGFTFNAGSRSVIFDEVMPADAAGTVITVQMGQNNVDSPESVLSLLAGNGGGGYVTLSDGKSVQEHVNDLEEDISDVTSTLNDQAENIASQEEQIDKINANLVLRTDLSALYVATTGSDSNLGTQASPFLTLQAAVNKVLSGAVFKDVTINVGAGNFAGATIQGALYNGARILIVGASMSTTNFSSPIVVSRRADVKLQAVGTASQFVVDSYATLEVAGATFNSSAAVAHMYCNSGHLKVTSDYNVTAAAANFHMWVRGNGRLDCDVTTTITNTPNFQFFVYFEENSSIYCQGWKFVGATTGGRFVITDNAVVSAGTTTATQRDNFFPGDHGDTDTSIVDQPNVGGKFDGYPDYGFTTLFSVPAAGLSTVEFPKIPDCFSYMILKWYGVNLSADGATFNIQVKPAGQTAYNTDASFYQKIDTMNASTPEHPTSASLINVQPKVSGGAACYGSIQLPGFHGGAYPLVNGCYTDNANIFHSIQGVFLDPNWIRNIRFITSAGTFSSGTFELIAVM